jgi:hypothetical protein
MRLINFRGRSIKTGKWVYGSLVTTNANPNVMMIDVSDDKDEMYHEIEYVDPETVGQFTGQYDFNGHPIYVGDKLMNKYEEKPHHHSYVFFRDGMFRVALGRGEYPLEDWFIEQLMLIVVE